MTSERRDAGQPHVYPLPRDGSAAPEQRRRTLVRPYARTGGRTRPEHDFELEAMVSTTDAGMRHEGVQTMEQRSICDFCTQPRAISDIVTELGLPIGVVKVIVADMMRAGLVHVHDPGLPFGEASSRQFLDRLLSGLRNL
ncbi:DUF742 domain-containing protein [Haloechinothrix sp. LS1_15]|uniref:DUF742 domain-containing protein n=1 Tax=Haloechinothrix sp. LS1_15 TaxID=2652248 RepID=UPI0029450131|nr:DUF742 domain-containing protein [Haloechinothrix sp. LS1_15]MDV6014387.1 DUF742 domain-containing protein [Haloechinothrix sp. LS1_15]